MRSSCWSRKRARRAPHAPCFHVRACRPPGGVGPTIDRTMWLAQGVHSVFKRSGHRFASRKRVKKKSSCQPYDGAMSAARMGAAVDFEQPFAVDAGIDLRGRERGVPEQLLDGAE